MSSARVAPLSAQRSAGTSASLHQQRERQQQQQQAAAAAAATTASKTHHLQLVADKAKSDQSAAVTVEEESCIPKIDRSVHVRPGKRGGRYQLPDGGHLAIPEAGGFSRSDNVTVSAVQPSELVDYCFRLGELEALVSPVYHLGSSVRTLRCQLALRLPMRLPAGEPGPFKRLRLLHRGSGGATWKEMPPTSLEADNSGVTVDTRSLGTYLMLLSPLEETFQITPNGGLIDFRIDQSMSLRVPKNAFPVPRLFKLRILPFSEQGTALAHQLRRSETMDIGSVSPMYSFRCDDDHDHHADNDAAPIKRGLTVKLPMPPWLRDADRKEAQARLAIAVRPDDGTWGLLDAKHASVRLTRTSVSFESKQLAARFCFLDAPQARLLRAAQGLGHLEVLNEGRPGRLALYTAFDRRRWALCVRCGPVPAEGASSGDDGEAVAMRWQPLLPLPPPGARVERAVRAGRTTAAGVAAAAAAAEAAKSEQLLLHDGDVFVVQLTGDFQLRRAGSDDAASETVHLQYHQQLADRPVVYDIVPTDRSTTIASDFFSYLLELAEDEADRTETTEGKLVDKSGNETLTFRGAIKVSHASAGVISSHEFSVGFHALKQYLDLKPPPPPPPPPAAHEGEDGETQGGRQPAGVDDPKAGGWFHYPRILKLRIYELDPQQARLESQQRLLAPRRNAAQPAHAREPRVLSRRSLQTLAQQVTQGVTLAAELGVPESAVSALGFEAMSSRSSGSNFTFRVLLYWKRACATPELGSLAEQLADALTRMERQDLAAVVRDCLAGSREIAPERFGQ